MDSEVKHKKVIVVLSVLIPLVVAALFGIKLPNVDPLYSLPPIYAGINALTAVLLVVALLAIKKGNRKVHEGLMKVCIGLSVAFLGMYVAYHMTSQDTKYGGEYGFIYYPILIGHIVLSIAVIPLVLLSYSRAIASQFELHKKITRISFPVWLFVAVSGVVVYLMISPYYPVV